jgi:hypothetical protein
MATPTIAVDYFLTLFEEFGSANKTKVGAFIDIASSRVSPTVWGANAKYATALLTAHMLASTGHSPSGGMGGSAGGALTGESVGDLSRNYSAVGVAGSGDQELMTTRYGMEFVALRRETICAPMATGNTTLPGSGGC